MYARILVPLDGSAPSRHGLQEAVSLAKTLGSQLVLLHVVDDFPKRLELVPAEAYEQSLERLRQRGRELLQRAHNEATEAGVAARTKLREIDMETIADAIVDESRSAECQLIVMGTHGRRGMRRIALGSDAEMVLRTSTVPVLLVRRDDDTA